MMGLSPNMQTVVALGAYVVFSTAVSSLPPPQPGGSPFYEWFYKFSNGLATNITALRGKAAFDPVPQKVSVETQTATVTTTASTEPKP